MQIAYRSLIVALSLAASSLVAQTFPVYVGVDSVFAGEIVLRNKCLNLIPHCLVDRHLARDRGSTRGFRTTTSFQDRTTIARGNATQFRRTLTSSKRPAFTSL